LFSNGLCGHSNMQGPDPSQAAADSAACSEQ
jgi:hypothetical protein